MSDPEHNESRSTLGLTLAIVLGPLGFFSVYALAFSSNGFRSGAGAAALAAFAALMYIGLAFLGTQWFEKHRRE